MMKRVVMCGAVLVLLGAALHSWLNRPTFYRSLVEVMEEEYDFVIVGGGTAGVVLATRLTEHRPNVHVLLLEAGLSGVDNLELRTPLLWPHFNRQTEFGDAQHQYVWSYRSEPQQHACLAVHEERCLLPRGKVLGGSSALGNMLYERGHREDYQRWSRELNCGDEWSYEQVNHILVTIFFNQKVV